MKIGYPKRQIVWYLQSINFLVLVSGSVHPNHSSSSPMKWPFLPLVISSKVLWLQGLSWPNFVCVCSGHIRCFLNLNYTSVHLQLPCAPMYPYGISIVPPLPWLPWSAKGWTENTHVRKITKGSKASLYVMHNTETSAQFFECLGQMEGHPCLEFGIWCSTCFHYLGLDPNI